MDKKEIIRKIENFAPPELAESWDCSGILVETDKTEINRIMLCLTVTKDIIRQAKEQNCDMIISHHPLFYIPIEWKNIDIYCAHTNMDKTQGGTTDTIIKTLGMEISETNEFVRYSNTEISLKKFLEKLKKISPNLRYTNNSNIKTLNKIAFCAGSGMEFIEEAQNNGANAFVSGDLKFHPALDSEIVVVDIGHFESEILILSVFSDIIGNDVKKIFAQENSPFKYLK